jgi:adenylate kinase
MKGNIIFIGGIHGVGKGTLCKKVADELNMVHLTASDVLKWSDFTEDPTNKRVKDIKSTQDRLLENLDRIIQPQKTYLLDGHFCLQNNEGVIEKVPDDIFIGINPIKIVLVTEEPEEIGRRLFQRDGKEYDVNLLKQMQEIEKEHALHISQLLGREFYEIHSDSIITFKEIVSVVV